VSYISPRPREGGGLRKSSQTETLVKGRKSYAKSEERWRTSGYDSRLFITEAWRADVEARGNGRRNCSSWKKNLDKAPGRGRDRFFGKASLGPARRWKRGRGGRWGGVNFNLIQVGGRACLHSGSGISKIEDNPRSSVLPAGRESAILGKVLMLNSSPKAAVINRIKVLANEISLPILVGKKSKTEDPPLKVGGTESE